MYRLRGETRVSPDIELSQEGNFDYNDSHDSMDGTRRFQSEKLGYYYVPCPSRQYYVPLTQTNIEHSNHNEDGDIQRERKPQAKVSFTISSILGTDSRRDEMPSTTCYQRYPSGKDGLLSRQKSSAVRHSIKQARFRHHLVQHATTKEEDPTRNAILNQGMYLS